VAERVDVIARQVIIFGFAVYNLFLMAVKDEKFIKYYKMFIIFLLVWGFLTDLLNYGYDVMIHDKFFQDILFLYISYPLMGGLLFFFWFYPTQLY